MIGNHAVVSRVTERPRPRRVMVRGRASRQRKRSVTKVGAGMVMRDRKLHLRHDTGKLMKRNKTIRHGAGKPMKMSRTARDETGNLMKKIKTLSNNGIGKPMRRKRDTKGPRIDHPMEPREAVLPEKNSTRMRMARAKAPREDTVTWPSIPPRAVGGPKQEKRVKVILLRQQLLPIPSMTTYKSRKSSGTRPYCTTELLPKKKSTCQVHMYF